MVGRLLMPRQNIVYEWSVIDDAEWQPLRQEGPLAFLHRHAAGLTEPQVGLPLLRAFVLMMAALALTSAAFSPPTERRPWGYEAVASVLQLEAQAWAARDDDLLSTLIDVQTPARMQDDWRLGWNSDAALDAPYRTQLLSVEPVGNLLEVQVRVEQRTAQWWLSSPHRETRFYRQMPHGWVRSLPDASHWGVMRAVETPHLRFEFYDHDMPTVIAIADRIEMGYVRVHQWLGVSPPVFEDKLVFAVVPELVRGWGGYGNRHHLTSPALAKVPLELSDSDYLVQQIMNRVVSRALNLLFSDTERTNAYQWRTMMWALSGWLRTELAGRRSPWHEQAEALFVARTVPQLPLSLAAIESRYPAWRIDQEGMMLDYMAAESVVAYVIETYGPEYLPQMVVGFQEYGSWIGFVPDLFDQSVDEFEAGWNRYLAMRFGSTQPGSPVAAVGD